MRAWLQQAAAIDWPPAEFQALAETLARFEAFDLLQDIRAGGAQARSREPDMAVPPHRRPHQGQCRSAVPRPRWTNCSRWPRRLPSGKIFTRPTGSNGSWTEMAVPPFGRGQRRFRRRRSRWMHDAIGELFAAMMDDMPKGPADNCAGWSWMTRPRRGRWRRWSSKSAPPRSDRRCRSRCYASCARRWWQRRWQRPAEAAGAARRSQF